MIYRSEQWELVLLHDALSALLYTAATFSAALSTNVQPLLLSSCLCFVSVSLTKPVHNCLKRFLCFSSLYIHVPVPLSQREQVNVNLHYLSLSLMNSPSLPESLEYYTSQSVNTSRLVNIITLCNLIASLQASFNSLVPACLSSCHCIKQQTLIFPLYPGGSH